MPPWSVILTAYKALLPDYLFPGVAPVIDILANKGGQAFAAGRFAPESVTFSLALRSLAHISYLSLDRPSNLRPIGNRIELPLGDF